MAYKPKQYGVIRDEMNVAEIAGHRPALATRLTSEMPFEERDPVKTLRGQPTEVVEDETYHHGENVARFNAALRSGIGTGRPTNDE